MLFLLNEYAKDGKREQNNKFSSLGHSINTSCLYELQTCSRPNKVQEKTFVLSKNLPEFLFTRRAAAASINDFINAMKKKQQQRNKLIVLH